MNPLDFPGNPVQFEVRNISWRGSSSAKGPMYKITMEVDPLTFERFSGAKLESASFAVVMNRVDEAAQASTVDPLAKALAATARAVVGGTPPAEEPADDPFTASNREAIKPPTGLRCRESVGMMKEKDFTDYVKFVNMEFNGNDTPKEFVQIMCGIESRREFDEGPDADEKYAVFCGIRKKYREWQGMRK